MTGILSWLKQHKLVTLLFVIILLLLSKKFYSPMPMTMRADNYGVANSGVIGSPGMPIESDRVAFPMPKGDMSESSLIPPSDSANRMVMQETSLSLLVKNVEEVKTQILNKTKQVGGFMINTSLQNPQDAATATISIRVPSNKLDETLDSFKGLAVKVVSEYVQGEDVTDQYTDIQARMDTLLTTKTKFEDIMKRATEIQDILQVQNELINLQSQIDALKGQQQYLEKNVQLSRVTIFLSTDELALPYQPNESWRPALIFKEAVRSLIGTFRGIGSMLIWLAVYSVVWIPALVIFYFWRRSRRPTQRI